MTLIFDLEPNVAEFFDEVVEISLIWIEHQTIAYVDHKDGGAEVKYTFIDYRLLKANRT